MEKKTKYYDYIQLDRLLTSQIPIGELKETGKPAHHQTFFIIIHQVYELWFKAILFELDSILKTFEDNPTGLDERDIGIIVSKLNRIIEILTLLIAQISVMETLTPLDFLDFRELLRPASGYDSLQFHLIEVKLGLGLERGEQGRRFDPERKDEEGETKYGDNSVALKHIEELKEADKNPSLFDYVQAWLERTPFVTSSNSRDWFRKSFAVIADIRVIFEENVYSKFLDEIGVELGFTERKRLSHDAFLAALFIHLYRDEPILQNPHRLLESLKQVDELFTVWRNWHSSMVMRMIGKKEGTAGEGLGYDYLVKTVRSYKFFPEIDRVSTYLISRADLPDIPNEVKEEMDFHYSIKPRDAKN